MTSRWNRLRIDPQALAMLAVVAVAAVLPARETAAAVLGDVTRVLIAVLFFLYGARLSARAAIDGLRHWRLHIVVLSSTFMLFPLLGLAARLFEGWALTAPLYIGVVFLCVVPSTVQSSIAFTSVARGNVAAAICAASFSNLIGVLLTPFLASVLLDGAGGLSVESIADVALQLLVPFLLGQLSRRWIGDWVLDHKSIVGIFDRGVILLVVYSAFSKGMAAGIWHELAPVNLAVLLAVCAALLAAMLLSTSLAARWMKFPIEDRIAIVFCGSKKSLASGLPMASVLFAGHSVALTVLPLMLFHQLQLLVCATLAHRYGSRPVGSS